MLTSDRRHYALVPSTDDEGARREAVRRYRSDCCSRMADRLQNLLAAAHRAEADLVSRLWVVRLQLFIRWVLFWSDIASDGLLGKALLDAGSLLWGSIVLGLMAVPYVIMLAALLPLASKTLARRCQAPLCETVLLWVLVGIPTCFAVDVYLTARHLCSSPRRVEIFHYATLRGLAASAGAQLQFFLQGYLVLRQLNPVELLLPRNEDGDEVEAEEVDPRLLAVSILLSLCTTLSGYGALQAYVANHCEGHLCRFLWHICQLGGGLAPSSLFHQLQSWRRVVIAYDLKGVSYREMRRLSILTRRAQWLEELIFEDAGWISALPEAGTVQDLVAEMVYDFGRATNLRQFELRGDKVPDWAFREVQAVARLHPHLQEGYVEGCGTVYGSLIRRLPRADPLLQATHEGDVAGVGRAGAAPLEVHAEAVALAASSNSLELLRALLLKAGGFDAVHSPGGHGSGLILARDGALPLHFAAVADNDHALQLLQLAGANVNDADAHGNTPLLLAARDDRAKALAQLLQARAEVDKPNSQGTTPLHVAAEENNVACAQLLLSCHADPNRRHSSGATPVFLASENESLQTLRLLLHARGGLDQGVADSAAAVLQAAQRDGVESLRFLLAERADLDQATSDGITPAMVAAQHKSVESLRFLLDHGANVNAAVPGSGLTPLCLAAQHDSDQCVRLLIDRQAEVDRVTSEGATPALIAAQHNSPEALRMLLAAKADANHAMHDGATPVFAAARHDSAKALRVLIGSRADASRATNDGATPIFIAAQQNSVDSLRLLLPTRANMNQAKEDGSTPVFIASQNNSSEILRLLLAEGANMNRAMKAGATPVFIAAQQNSTDCLKRLLENRADMNQPRDNGATPIFIAAQKNSVDCLRLLLFERANIKQALSGGVTPVLIAAQQNSTESLRALLDRRADMTVADDEGASPAFRAAQHNGAESLRLLLDRRADMNWAVRSGATPLVAAASTGSTRALSVLLNARADLHLPVLGLTPLEWAQQQGHSAAASLIVRAVAERKVL